MAAVEAAISSYIIVAAGCIVLIYRRRFASKRLCGLVGHIYSHQTEDNILAWKLGTVVEKCGDVIIPLEVAAIV